MRKAINLSAMTPLERRAAVGLASIYGFRMLGLFLILPVFALYAETLEGVTPWLVGIAIGIYGLTQAALQIPFGFLSDRFGRKPMIIGGLLLFAIGSAVAALANDIYSIIIGRALQGSGAIAAVVMALASDVTSDTHRTRVMAIIGMTIGMSFMLALITGPTFYRAIGVDGIFWLTAGLAIVGILILIFVVPGPVKIEHQDTRAIPSAFKEIISNPDLLRLDLGIFCLHMILTALFLAVPLMLRNAGLPLSEHSWLYLVVLIGSIGFMVPFIILAERKGKIQLVFPGAITVLMLVLLAFFIAPEEIVVLGVLLGVFFVAFNLLEAMLPSLISKIAPADIKGAAMGVYSTGQFLGAFLGGFIGGWINMQYGLHAVFAFSALVALFWLLGSIGLKYPQK